MLGSPCITVYLYNGWDAANSENNFLFINARANAFESKIYRKINYKLRTTLGYTWPLTVVPCM